MYLANLTGITLALAGRGGGAGGGGGAAGGDYSWIILLLAMFAVLWFLMIRPQRQREARRKQMLEQLKKSDHVVTIGGIHGVITQIRGDQITLKVDEANNVKMTFTRSAIARVIDRSGEGEESEKK